MLQSLREPEDARHSENVWERRQEYSKEALEGLGFPWTPEGSFGLEEGARWREWGQAEMWGAPRPPERVACGE